MFSGVIHLTMFPIAIGYCEQSMGILVVVEKYCYDHRDWLVDAIDGCVQAGCRPGCNQ